MLGRFYHQAPMAVWTLGVAALILFWHAQERWMVRARMARGSDPLGDIFALSRRAWGTLRAARGLHWALLGYLVLSCASGLLMWYWLITGPDAHIATDFEWSLGGRFEGWSSSVLRALPVPLGTLGGGLGLGSTAIAVAAVCYLVSSLARGAEWATGQSRKAVGWLIGLLAVGAVASVVLHAFWRPLTQLRPPWSMVSFGVCSLLTIPVVQLPWVVVAAWLYAARRPGELTPGRVRSSVLRAAPGLAAVGMLVWLPEEAALVGNSFEAYDALSVAGPLVWALLFPLPWMLMEHNGRPLLAVRRTLRAVASRPVGTALFAVRYWALLVVALWFLPTLRLAPSLWLWYAVVGPLIWLLPVPFAIALMLEAHTHLGREQTTSGPSEEDTCRSSA